MYQKTEDGITYCINSLHTLIKMVNGGERRDVIIPRFLRDGTRIDSLGECFCKGPYRKLLISEEIEEVQKKAFQAADAEEVCWNPAFLSIPDYCFARSKVQNIYNIDKVVRIGEGAFFKSNIKAFAVPDSCNKLPDSCFAFSSLRVISNTEKLISIEPCAFSNTNLLEFIWPSKCYEIPSSCFAGCALERISNINHVTLIGNYAFYNTEKLQKIDLSNSMVSVVGKGAFFGFQKDEVEFPYYMETKYIKHAFDD